MIFGIHIRLISNQLLHNIHCDHGQLTWTQVVRMPHQKNKKMVRISLALCLEGLQPAFIGRIELRRNGQEIKLHYTIRFFSGGSGIRFLVATSIVLWYGLIFFPSKQSTPTMNNHLLGICRFTREFHGFWPIASWFNRPKVFSGGPMGQGWWLETSHGEGAEKHPQWGGRWIVVDHWLYPLVNVNKKTMERSTMLLMGKSTISMAIFHS